MEKEDPNMKIKKRVKVKINIIFLINLVIFLIYLIDSCIFDQKRKKT
jgi:hypothetical protein